MWTLAAAVALIDAAPPILCPVAPPAQGYDLLSQLARAAAVHDARTAGPHLRAVGRRPRHPREPDRDPRGQAGL